VSQAGTLRSRAASKEETDADERAESEKRRNATACDSCGSGHLDRCKSRFSRWKGWFIEVGQNEVAV
jgi:hypothetical protein